MFPCSFFFYVCTSLLYVDSAAKYLICIGCSMCVVWYWHFLGLCSLLSFNSFGCACISCSEVFKGEVMLRHGNWCFGFEGVGLAAVDLWGYVRDLLIVVHVWKLILWVNLHIVLLASIFHKIQYANGTRELRADCIFFWWWVINGTRELRAVCSIRSLPMFFLLEKLACGCLCSCIMSLRLCWPLMCSN